MGKLIKQEPLKKVRKVTLDISIIEDVAQEINEYCKYAGIRYGLDDNGVPKTGVTHIQRYFVQEAIKRVLEEDRDEIQRLKDDYVEDEPKIVEHDEQLELVSQVILGDDMEGLASIFDGEDAN